VDIKLFDADCKRVFSSRYLGHSIANTELDTYPYMGSGTQKNAAL